MSRGDVASVAFSPDGTNPRLGWRRRALNCGTWVTAMPSP